MATANHIHVPHEGAAKSNDKRLQRINSGSGHWYKIDGQKADGVSWVLNNSVPKGALVGWAAGKVAEECFDNPQGVESLKSLGREAFVKAMKEVPNNDRDQAANKGTHVHKMAELIAKGEEVDVPNYIAGHVDSYVDWDETFKPTKMMTEVTVFHLKQRIGGTLDIWCHLERMKGVEIIFPDGRDATCRCEDECLSIVDIKTSRSGVFGDTALQLAPYGNAEVYIDAAGNIRPMPEIRHYYVLWLRSDGYELYPYNVTPKTWKKFLYCQQVAHFNDWKTGDVRNVKGEPISLPKL